MGKFPSALTDAAAAGSNIIFYPSMPLIDVLKINKVSKMTSRRRS